MTRPDFMDLALAEARLAAARGETPVGAVLVFEDRVLARAGNETRARNDPTAHAEMLAIRVPRPRRSPASGCRAAIFT